MLAALAAAASATGLVETGELEIGAPAEAVQLAQKALSERRFDEAARTFGALADAGGGADARVAQAVALYQAGELHAARAAAERALAADPRTLAGQNVLALTLVDGGELVAGIARLEAAAKAAEGLWKGRVLVNLALACSDRGDAPGARAALEGARSLVSGDPGVAAAFRDAEATVSALAGEDAGVGRALGRGDLAGARAQAEGMGKNATSRIEKLGADIALAAVDRAEGRLDAASTRLISVVQSARSSGLKREAAIGLGNLGIVQSLAGRLPLAADTLRAGATLAHEGGYAVVEVDNRCELGIVLVHLGELDAAQVEQRAAGALLAAMAYPQGVARQGELGGQIAAAGGDLATAERALAAAVAHHEKRGRSLDAARAAVSLAAAFQAAGDARARDWSRRAEAAFAKAGERLGPAHVAIALALADARADRRSEALAGFARGAELAQKVGGDRGEAVARIARDDAAALLAQADIEVTDADLRPYVERYRKLMAAASAYDAGLAAYEARKWEEARARFAESRTGFEAISEPEYAMRARRAAAWAVYNHTVALPASKAYAAWTRLVDETAKLDEPELFTRTYAAAALAAHALGQQDPTARLQECTKQAERIALYDVGARCHGALAERDGDLEARAAHARAAHALAAADASSAYALYSVAVDAYNNGRNDLAIELATLARPNAGALAASVDAVLAAARTEAP